MPPKPAKPASRSARATGRSLSIVVPVFNEARSLETLHAKISDVARRLASTRGLRIEVVYVDDGSSDATYRIASTLPASGLDIQALALSRNFGKEAALLAGLDHARNEAVLFMDGDGQHPPELIETLVARWLDDNYDVVYTAKAHRDNEPWARRTGVGLFYRLINWGSRHPIPEDAGDFRLLSPRAAAALRRLPERSRFFKGLSSWIGFRQVRVDYEPALRAHGATTWNVWSLLAFSIEGLTSFSVAPLRFASLLGIALAASALCFGFWMVLETILFGKDVPGYPSLVVGLMVIGGVQLIMIGVLGEYIGKLMWESKARPVYLVAEQTTKDATAGAKAAPAAARGE
ncbi:MAG: glycosyltransferase family 2 protein [Pseudolabrys sp.]|nr:glycosyltransferase family 2 protein [Pseudolabrys sp.]